MADRIERLGRWRQDAEARRRDRRATTAKVLILACAIGAGCSGATKPSADAAAAGADAVGTADGSPDATDATSDATDATAAPWTGPCTPLGPRFCAANPLPFAATVQAIAARADDDVWFVGDGALLAHWDGKAVSVHALTPPRPAQFLAVAAPSADCAWAAGGYVVARWDGQSWQAIADPPDQMDQLVVDDCDHPIVLRIGSKVAYRWDGAAWQPLVTAAELGLNALERIGARAGHVWVVGSGDKIRAFEQTAAGFVDRSPVARDPDLYGIDQLVVRPDGTVVALNLSAFFDYDGSHWTRTDLPFPPGLRGFALGLQGQRYGLLQSTAATIDGATVTPLGPPLYRPVLGGDFTLGALAATPGGSLWVGGRDGQLARWSGGNWTTLTGGPPWDMHAGAVVDGIVVAAGALGILRLTDNTVALRDLTPANSAAEYFAIEQSGGEVMLGGYEYTATAPIVRWSGEQFTPEHLPVGLHRVLSLLRVDGAWWAVAMQLSLPSAIGSGVYARDASGNWTTVREGAAGTYANGWSDGSQAIIVGGNASNTNITHRYHDGNWDEPLVGGPRLGAPTGPDIDHLYAIGDRTLHRYDGGAWTLLHTFAEGYGLRDLAVHGDDVWIVADRHEPQSPWAVAAAVVRWNGGVVEESIVPGMPSANGVFLVGATPWIVGAHGALVRLLGP